MFEEEEEEEEEEDDDDDDDDDYDDDDGVVAVCMTMSKGIVALFSTSGRPVVPFVHLETGTTFSMPYITTGPSVNRSALTDPANETEPLTEAVTDSEHLSLHVRPLIHDAMLAVIHRHRWTVVYYLYDSDHGTSRCL